MKENKNAVVTGGAGFIGSHLCERLLLEGYNVVSIDNYFTGKEENHIKGVRYIKGNTKDIKWMGIKSPDILYHLGEYSRVEQSFEDIKLVLVDGKIKINGENKNTFSARKGQRYKIDISHPSLAQAEDVVVFDGRNREPILQGLNFRGVPGQDKSRITYVASQNSEIILEPENLTLPSDVPTRGCKSNSCKTKYKTVRTTVSIFSVLFFSFIRIADP